MKGDTGYPAIKYVYFPYLVIDKSIHLPLLYHIMSIVHRFGIFIIFITFFITACTSPFSSQKPPVAKEGVIDLKDWDLMKDGPVMLDGEWKFLWMQTNPVFAQPGYDDSDWDTYTVPSFWNKKMNSRYGYAWFRLKVINVKNPELMAIYLVHSCIAYTLYCNGKLILKNGKTGKSRKESIPQRIPLYFPIENSEEFVLAWEISNFDNPNGGPGYSPELGLYTDIKNNYIVMNYIVFITLGIIIMMAIYHFFLWLFHKEDKASLYFSLFCLVIVIRVFFFYRYIDQIFADSYIYELSFKIELLTMPCGIIMFLIFLRTVLITEFSKLLFKILLFLSAIYSFITIAGPFWLASDLFYIYAPVLIASGIWITFMIVLALIRKKPDSGIIFFSILILFLSVIIDVGATYLPRVNISTINFGLVGFIFSQSILLSRRFTSAYKTANYLSENLQKEVDLKTREITAMAREKTDFFINLAHETKTPLTLINNYLEKYIETHGIDENLEVMRDNFLKLKTDMINFLDYEKLVLGQVFYNHGQVVDFTCILKSIIPLYIKLAKNRGIVLIDSIENGIFLKADPYAVDRVINNLIDNAIKYTGEGGEIAVSLKKEETGVVFCVKDTGAGISEKQLQFIFKPYSQLSHKKRNTQGIGMGLNIVKKIVEEIDGKIEVTSELNKGTSFRVFFKEYNPEKGDDIQGETEDHTIVYGTEKKKLIESEIIKGRYNIFIVEDNIDMLYYLQDSLKTTYNVFYAINGEDALQKIDTIPLPHIIISDIMMDPMDGYEFYENLKMKSEYSYVPFIFLTALTSREERIKAIKKGAVDSICKPFHITELKAKIESLIKLQESLKIRNELEMEERILNAIRNRKSRDDKYYSFENKCSHYNITEREKEVIRLVLQGKEDKEISSQLNLSYHTIRTHIRNIYKKCKINNKVALVNVFKNE